MVDNQVDQTTGTVKLKAEFPNSNTQLWPGQFVNVRMLVDTLKQVVVVPTAAVQRGPIGIFVYVVDADNTVAVRPVAVSQQDETQAVIARGVQVGERVVTTGFARLTAGAKVVVTNAEDVPAVSATADSPAAGVAKTANQAAVNKAANRREDAPTLPLARRNERFDTIHPAADRDLAARCRRHAGWLAGLFFAAGRLAAAGRLPHDSGDHAASGREPGHHGGAGDRAARTPVRANSGALDHDLVEFVRHLADHACSSISTATSTARPRTCRRRSMPPVRHCRAIFPIRPPTPR